MSEVGTTSLVEQLRSVELRIRTGILIVPHSWLGQEDDIAAHLGISCQDLCVWILDRVPKGRKTLGIKVEEIIENLTQILNKPELIGSCILVSNSDFLLAGLSYDDRLRFWDFIRCSFRREKGLLLSFPQEATNLLPIHELKNWSSLERLAIWKDE